MRVKDLMNKAVIASPEITLKQAAKIMSQRKIGSLILEENNQIKGIITERDVVKHLSSLNKKVSLIMSKKPISIDLNEGIDFAAELMSKKKIKRLLVTEKGHLVGIITITNLIANSDILNEASFF